MGLNFSPFELAGRKTLLLAPGEFSTFGAKTAVCYLRYRTDDVVAVVDSTQQGRTVGEILGFGGDIPVVADVSSAVSLGAEVAIVGVAPQGGRLSDDLYALVMQCAEAGLDIVSGLHDFVADDTGIAAAADAHGARLWDVRRVPVEPKIGTGTGCKTGAKTVLIVGTDCNVGKMTVTVELYKEATSYGIQTAWAATGQTGMMLRGRGIAIDRVISDFISGATEELVGYEGRSTDLLLVEGQGSLVHPGYAGVTLGLMHGVMPDCMVMAHAASRDKIGDSQFDMPSLPDVIGLYEAAMSPFGNAPVVAVAVNTAGFEETAARDIIESIKTETGLPACDPVRFGCRPVLDAVVGYLE